MAWGGRLQVLARAGAGFVERVLLPQPESRHGDAERVETQTAAELGEEEAGERVETRTKSRSQVRREAAQACARRRLRELERRRRQQQARGKGSARRRETARRALRLAGVVRTTMTMATVTAGCEGVMQGVWQWKMKMQADRGHMVRMCEDARQQGMMASMVFALRVVWVRRWFKVEVQVKVATWRANAVRATQRECQHSEKKLMVKGLGPGAHELTCEGCHRSRLSRGWHWKYCATCMLRTSQLVGDMDRLKRKKPKRARNT